MVVPREPERRVGAAPESFGEATHRFAHLVEAALRIPEPAGPAWHRAGLTPRGERVFDVLSTLIVLVLAAGWSWALVLERAGVLPTVGARTGALSPVSASVAAALTTVDAPGAAYVTDALVDAVAARLRGTSGKLRARILPPRAATAVGDSIPGGASVEFAPAGTAGDTVQGSAPPARGIWSLLLRLGNAIRPVADFAVITTVPTSTRRNGRIGLYYIGTWPTERRAGAPPKAPPGRYAPPSGFIEVTPQNEDTHVSEHFRLRDFLTHDQQDVWPKYLVLDTRLVDKLELVLSDLAAHGVDVHGVHVMSGFRTPQYNAMGGDPTGRAGLSRHMYGDAADIFIDSDGDGRMDDLNHDGRVDIRDAEVIRAAVDRVEQAHPELVGGCGTYVATPAHGPFTHIDTRGYRARWTGTGDS